MTDALALDAVRSAVLAGLGYAVLPLAAIGEFLASGALYRVRTGRPSLARTFRALRRPVSHSPALDAFWGHLGAVADKGAPNGKE
jgi:DNA-binding transcriptional LysR family regulator